jgi:hypothetical protein
MFVTGDRVAIVGGRLLRNFTGPPGRRFDVCLDRCRRPAASWAVAVAVAMLGSIWVSRDLIGPGRLGLQRVVAYGALAQEACVVLAVVWVAKRRTRAVVPPRAPRQRMATSRSIALILSAWVAFTGLLIASRIGCVAGATFIVTTLAALGGALMSYSDRGKVAGECGCARLGLGSTCDELVQSVDVVLGVRGRCFWRDDRVCRRCTVNAIHV